MPFNSSTAPLATVTVEEFPLNAVELLTRSVPAEIVVLPVNVFAPERVRVPAPALMMLFAVVPSEMTPARVRVLPLTVMVRDVPAAVPSVVVPLPRLRLPEPV